MTTKEDIYLKTRSTLDACKGVRSCFRSITNTIASYRIATGVVIAIPMAIMVCTLILEQYAATTAILAYRYILAPPIYVISTLTFLFGTIGMICVRLELQNLLGFAAFVYAGIGYWALINILILMSAGWAYLPMGTMVNLLMWVSVPTCMWLFASSVMDRHRILVSDAIAASTASVSAPKAGSQYPEMEEVPSP